MKKFGILLISLFSLMFFISGCSDPKNRIVGKEYKHNQQSGQDYSEGIVYDGTIYKFGSQGVSIFLKVGRSGNILLDKKKNHLFSSNGNVFRREGFPRGSTVAKTEEGEILEIVFGPGDMVPVLENAPYKVEGSSIYVDWSQNHSKYFELTFCDSGSEVFTIKNEGLVLESATRPGKTLTLDMSAH